MKAGFHQIEDGKIALDVAGAGEIRLGFQLSPAIDLSGYTKLKYVWETEPAGLSIPDGGNLMFTGGADNIWSSVQPENNITGKPNLTYFQFWVGTTGDINTLYISSISFE